MPHTARVHLGAGCAREGGAGVGRMVASSAGSSTMFLLLHASGPRGAMPGARDGGMSRA